MWFDYNRDEGRRAQIFHLSGDDDHVVEPPGRSGKEGGAWGHVRGAAKERLPQQGWCHRETHLCTCPRAHRSESIAG
jgi:hypothetical protein